MSEGVKIPKGLRTMVCTKSVRQNIIPIMVVIINAVTMTVIVVILGPCGRKEYRAEAEKGPGSLAGTLDRAQKTHLHTSRACQWPSLGLLLMSIECILTDMPAYLSH